jgi:hypothetical protein
MFGQSAPPVVSSRVRIRIRDLPQAEFGRDGHPLAFCAAGDYVDGSLHGNLQVKHAVHGYVVSDAHIHSVVALTAVSQSACPLDHSIVAKAL